jgi:glucose-1-phosphate cytidylyltransferase
MKAVILCGGQGIRMAGETEFRPKPLIMIGGKPLLWHIIKIYAHQGVKEFVLCLGYKGEMIKEYFLNLREMSNDFVLHLGNKKVDYLGNDGVLDGVKIYFIDTGLNAQTGSRVAKAEKYISDDEDFFLTYGDGVADVDLKDLYRYHKKMGKIGTITTVSPYYKFGIVKIDQDLIKEFNEKPEMKERINGGFMIFNKKFFDYVSTDDNCFLEQEPLKRLAAEGQLTSYLHQGYWQCMDTPKEISILERDYKNGAPWALWENNEEIFEKAAFMQKSEKDIHQQEEEGKKEVDEVNFFNENG